MDARETPLYFYIFNVYLPSYYQDVRKHETSYRLDLHTILMGKTVSITHFILIKHVADFNIHTVRQHK